MVEMAAQGMVDDIVRGSLGLYAPPRSLPYGEPRQVDPENPTMPPQGAAAGRPPWQPQTQSPGNNGQRPTTKKHSPPQG